MRQALMRALERLSVACMAGALLFATSTVQAWVPHVTQCSVELGDGFSPTGLWDEPQATLDPAVALEGDGSPWSTFFAPSPSPIPWSRPPTADDARRAFDKAEQLQAAGRYDDALLELRVVEAVFPNIADRLAQLRGDLLLGTGQAEEACRAYLEAAQSLDRNVAARARVGYVRCGFALGARDAELRLKRLLARYPELPFRQDLRLLLADYEAKRKHVSRAIAIYRSIDLEDPSSAVAARARHELESLVASGVRVRPLTPKEETERAERLVYGGPIEQARTTVQELLERPRFPAPERARLQLLAARMARVEGRWEDAAEAVKKARALGMAGPESAKYLPPSTPQENIDDPEELQARGMKAVKQITRGRPINRLRNAQLRQTLARATEYGLGDVASEVLSAMAIRKKLPPSVLFASALSAIGIASDTSLAALLSTLLDVHRYRVSARYHFARALERSGQIDAAKEQYQKVLALDKSSTPYYSMWAEQRLSTLTDRKEPRVTKEQEAQNTLTPCPLGTHRVTAGDSHCVPDAGSGLAAKQAKKAAKIESDNLPTQDPELRRRAIRMLKPLIQAHGDAYPWLARAADLVKLDRYSEAADELNEAYLAYRDARGSARLRSGLEAVFSGNAPPRRGGDWNTRRARLQLTMKQKERLSELSELLGDHGIAVRFAGYKVDERPRAYEKQVLAAAKRYGVDPDLLFAVMRVESIYNRRIISWVGAIGLMQIMPRTGRLIANSLDIPDFQITDLLDPQTNLNFSAWYLASLLRRFEGHLPLAIAAYNGGPHNVRIWLLKSPENMPLDAFLEHIPFTETHRYVRRVLTHYAAYRAQHSLPMPQISLQLPKAKEDDLAF